MRVFLSSIGCRLNQSELEIMAAELRAGGHVIAANPEDAEAAIINSCVVTAAAEADSRKLLHHIERAGVNRIFLTGCWASLEGIEEGLLPKGTVIVPNQKKKEIINTFFHPSIDIKSSIAPRIPLPGKKRRTRAFIKVQEGCDYHCTFCITRVARGKSVSRPFAAIRHDIHAAELADVKEIVLTGTQLGGWGKDLPEKKSIAFLVNEILAQTNIPFIRLSSIEPWDIQEDFFSLFCDPRFCNHLHLPLQSGSHPTLKRMARKFSPQTYANLIEKIRSCSPAIAITTDIVVGFPGETEEEFRESLEFIKAMQFSGGHVFRFSPRPGTPAVDFPDQVAGTVKRERNKTVQDILLKSANQYKAAFIHKPVSVIWEQGLKQKDGSWIMRGLSTNYLRVQAHAEKNIWNTLSTVILLEDIGKYMLGEISK